MYKMSENKKSTLLRVLRYALCDLAIIVVSLMCSSLISYLNRPGNGYMDYFKKSVLSLPIVFIIFFVVFLGLGIYNTLWRYAGAREYIVLIAADVVASSLIIMMHFVFKAVNHGNYLYAIQSFIACVLISLFAFVLRCCTKLYIALSDRKRAQAAPEKSDESIMLIGAGSASDLLIREYILSDKLNNVKCILDDASDKIGTRLHGVIVYAGTDKIKEAVEKFGINEIIFAIPSLPRDEKAKILEESKKYCNTVKSVPNISEIIDGRISLSSVRDINMEDLLGREPIKTDLHDIMEYVSGKVVLVTGGGGSIGSELCRQIASYKPKKLVIVDIYENNAYEIQQELVRNYPELSLYVEIASVRDTQRMHSIFERYKPQLVYHAAAHKHVPLMEANPHEAIKNNVFGTLKTVMAASAYGVEKFVMISTDKAVNPTNIMGATKRICEMIVQSYNKRSNTEFVAVRFGNVLGSNGSVIPLFMKQIENGGPVTVTHPDIIRYFMTIPEAVSLVLQAGALAKGGEIFVLNMGKPVKILSLAENVIRMTGHTPYEDIDIKFTGLRPGEKLYEELLMSEEGLKETPNKLIFIGKPIEFDDNELFDKLQKLSELLGDETSDVRGVVSEIVKTYKYKG